MICHSHNDEFRFLRGEIRKITYTLTSKSGRFFAIESADADLYHDGKLMEKLKVKVNDHDIEFIVDTSKLTDRYYHVIMTCRINEETVKKQMGFVVTV